MIKVFTQPVTDSPITPADKFNSSIDDWIGSSRKKIEIISVHTNSNKYMFMITIFYKYI